MTLLSVSVKVFARIILDRVPLHLLEHQRPEQSGFTPKRSTIDRILALYFFGILLGLPFHLFVCHAPPPTVVS